MNGPPVLITLNEKLLKQAFEAEQNKPLSLSQYQYMALMYSRIKNTVAVLSDMKANKNYIYNGRVAKELGLDEHDTSEEIIP